MNLFETDTIAAGYAKDRPYPHPIVIDQINSYLKLNQKLDLTLDVGCGVGFSSIALLAIARNVIGVDPSKSMLSSAIVNERIEYFNYPAEDLPFDQKFDLITLAGSLNWINRPLFFAQATNVLRERCYVVIYDNDILGVMEEDDRFKEWYETVFSRRYPRPPRNTSPILSKEALGYGFELEHSQDYTNLITFNMESFIRYLFTLSNITAALEKKVEPAKEIKAWLNSSLQPYFNRQSKTIRFGGYIWYLKRM